MNKSEIIEIVSVEAGISKAAAERAVNSFLEAITDGLSRGERVTVSRFGTFELRKMKSKKVRLPYSDKKVLVPEHLRPAFIAGVGLKRAVGR